MASPNQMPTDFYQQINSLDRDLWRSQNDQTDSLKNYSERMNFTNEYRGNRAFDGLTNNINAAEKDILSTVDRNGNGNLVAGERNYGYLTAQAERLSALTGNKIDSATASVLTTGEKNASLASVQAERIGNNVSTQNERIGAAVSTQNERIGAAGATQIERVGFALNTQGERIGSALSTQAERIATQGSVQAERIANQGSIQSERIGYNINAQNERIANQVGMQNERVTSEVKDVLNTNFSHTIDGLHDVRARNTDNFAKTWVAQAEQNTLAYRNTADIARLGLESTSKVQLDLRDLDKSIGRLVNDNTTALMRLNMEGFSKTQVDIAKSEALLSKQMVESEAKLADKIMSLDAQRLRDKTYLGAAKGIVLDEYHANNFEARRCHDHHGHHHHRHYSRSRSPSPRRYRRGRRDDDDIEFDSRINVVTNIRDTNDLSNSNRSRAGAGAVNI